MPGVLLWLYDPDAGEWKKASCDASGHLKTSEQNWPSEYPLSDAQITALRTIGWDSVNGVWRKLAVNAEGKLIIDPSEVTLDKLGDVEVPTPADDDLVYWDAATSLWKARKLVDGDIPASICRDAEADGKVSDHADLTTGVHGVGASYIAKTSRADQLPKLHDADGDTKVDVEESADEDKIRMDVKGVETFHLDDAGVLTLVKQSGCLVYRDISDQTIPTATETKIEFNAEQFDIQGEFDSTTNYRFTAKTAGIYLCALAVRFLALSDGTRIIIRIKKNGTNIAMGELWQGGAGSPHINVATIAQLAVDDYLEGYAHQHEGSDIDIDTGREHTWMAVHKIA